ncbi:MAG: signal peptidase I [Pseudomonadota bacterium]
MTTSSKTLEKQNKPGGGAQDIKSEAIELGKTIAYAIGIALVLRIFLFQPFNIPSGSMIPNLLVGDYLFVSKYSYGYSRHSFPLSLGPIDGRIFESTPKRGDVAVFKLPRDGRTDYIKRVVGLPGDKIQMRSGVMYINGAPVKRERVEDYIIRRPSGDVVRSPQFRETMPNGVSYIVREETDLGAKDNTGVYEVPAGHYFMMGDNRDNSKDSRFLSDVGYVPAENLVGKAQRMFFSIDGAKTDWWTVWNWPVAVRYGRLLKAVE